MFLKQDLVSAKPAACAGVLFGHLDGHVFMSLVKCLFKLAVKWSINHAMALGTASDKWPYGASGEKNKKGKN